MAYEQRMPALSPTMTEGVLARWCKSEGESFRAGDVLAEVETDKAVMEMEAETDGVLARLLVPAGAEAVPVGASIALVLEEGEDESALAAMETKAAESEGKGAEGGEESGAERADSASPPAAAAHEREAGAPDLSPEYEGETREQTTRDALRDAMAEELRRDESVFLMGEEVAEYQGPYKVSVGLLEEFGARRIVDTPITEHGFAGLGIGAAFYGLRPIVEFMTFNFAMQAMDQLINSAGKTHYMSGGQVRVPIVFRGPNGAAARVGAQHSQCYASWFAHVPGLVVVSPATAADAKGLLKSSIRSDDPVIFLENEILYGAKGAVPTDADFTLPLGKARVVRAGTDATVTAFSLMVERALEAAEILSSEHGLSIEVIDLRTLRPLDTETVAASVRRTNRLVSVEEGWPFAGIGAEMIALAIERAFDWLDAPPVRVAAADVPLPYAANLEAMALPQSAQIVSAVRGLFGR